MRLSSLIFFSLFFAPYMVAMKPGKKEGEKDINEVKRAALIVARARTTYRERVRRETIQTHKSVMPYLDTPCGAPPIQLYPGRLQGDLRSSEDLVEFP